MRDIPRALVGISDVIEAGPYINVRKLDVRDRGRQVLERSTEAGWRRGLGRGVLAVWLAHDQVE